MEDWEKSVLYTLDKSPKSGIMVNAFSHIAELCNGSTTVSDSVCLGSNPSSAAKTRWFRSFGSIGFFVAILGIRSTS